MASQPTSKDPAIPLPRRVIAECVGTFLLVILVGSAGAWAKIALPGVAHPRSIPDLIFLGLSNGLALFFIIMIVGKISGVQINPAVTLALASTRRMPRHDVLPYLAAQFVGASLGAAAELLAFGEAAASRGHLGATTLASGVSLWHGALVEGLATAILVLTIMATAEDPRAPSGWAGFSIGMALATLVMVFAPVTGTALNPARAFGPDLVGVVFQVPVDWLEYAVAYLVAPICGSILAAYLYAYLAQLSARQPSSPDSTGGEDPAVEPGEQRALKPQPARS